MSNPSELGGGASSEAFGAARRRAFIQDLLADLGGRSDDLLSFDAVRRQLRLAAPIEGAIVHEIPMSKIVGSVGRYRDFTRAFLPRPHVDAARWTRIERLRGVTRLPPIDVFKVGESYFVRDGHHRVSVARTRGERFILARVVEIPVRVPLEPNTRPEDLILKSGYAEFLEATALDQSCPDQRIEVTNPGGYRSLLQHIEVHQFYMGLRSRTYPSLTHAAADWYENIYAPVVDRIRASEILAQFPGRTEADMYLWITTHRARLQMVYGDLQPDRTQASHEQAHAIHSAVDTFAEQHRVRSPIRWIRRMIRALFPRFKQPEPTPSHGSSFPDTTDPP